MKLSINQLPKRMNVRENKSYGILNWDWDNAYPQRIRLLIEGSGRSVNCIETYARFIEGNGFKDQTFWKAKINGEGLTNDKLLRENVMDYAFNKGFAIHVNWNFKFQISSLNIMPFEFTRLGIPDDEKYVGKIAIHYDWAKNYCRNIYKEDIEWIDVFNPNPDVIMAQVMLAAEKAGKKGDVAAGWENYKGQIFWYSSLGPSTYPKATLDSVIEDVDTDGQVKIFKNRLARYGFIDPVALIHKGKFQTEKERDEFKKGLKGFQGSEHEGNIMLIEVEVEEQVPEFKNITTDNGKEKKFEHTESTIHENIRQVVNVPPVLIGDLVAGKLGTAQEINDACKFYSAITNKERRIFEETYQNLFQYFATPVNPSNDYSIIPLTQLVDVPQGSGNVDNPPNPSNIPNPPNPSNSSAT